MKSPKFGLLNAVKVKGGYECQASFRGLICAAMQSAFGVTYAIVWNNSSESVMHEDQLEASTPG